MKTNVSKKILLVLTFLIFLIVAQTVSAGVTNPLPTELNLLKGESGRFKFQIQTIANNQEIKCSYYLADESLLKVSFDPSEIIVPAGTARDIYGTVTVPRELDYGTYEENFCISCKPTAGQAGTAVEINTCDLPIKVNVVTEEQKEAGKANMNIPPKPIAIPYGTLIAILIILAAMAVVYHLLKKGHLRVRVKKPVKRL